MQILALFTCYFKPLKSKPLHAYWVVLCNKYSLLVWQNKGFSPYFAHNFNINIAQMACKSGCFALQKCRFWSVRATLSQSKIIYFTNPFFFIAFFFSISPFSVVLNLLRHLLDFRTINTKCQKCKHSAFKSRNYLFCDVKKHCKVLFFNTLRFNSKLFVVYLAF